MKILKFVLAAIFCLGLTIAFPFTSSGGLDWVRAHGKLLLFGIALVNVFIGGAVMGGFFEEGIKPGFTYWFQPIRVKNKWNPTYGFGAITLLWNVFVIIVFVEP